MRLADALELVFLFDDVERTVVGDCRHGQANQRCKRRLIIERRAEDPAGLGQERGPPLGVLGFCSSRLLVRQRVRLLLGAATRGDVAEAPNPADGNFVDALGLRVPLECTAVFELEDIVARFVGMPIKLDDLRHELVRINQLLQRRVDRPLIVAAREDLRRNLPHVSHFLVETQNLAFEIDHQNAVGRRLQRRTQQRQGSARFRLRFTSRTDVLDESHDVHRVAAGGADGRHRKVYPDDASILPDVALLHFVLGEITHTNATKEIEAGGDIIRMGKILDLELQNLFAGVAGDLAIALIDRDPLLVEREMGNANGGLLESREQEMAGTA